MSAGLADAKPELRAGSARIIISTLAIGTGLLLLLFWPEAQAAFRVWLSSTAFGHCFLVLPIAAWLAWERRDAIRSTMAAPLPWVALAAVPLALVWLLAERLGIMEGRQLVAMTLLQVLALAVLGWRAYRVASVPLLYLFFLVPFGAFLVPALQDFTTGFIDVGLDLLGVPHLTNATVIEIPEGAFRVAEACAGLRFLIASIAFGVLYACVIYRSSGRRWAFIGASVAIPIVANGIRALGIVELAHLLGSAEAVEVDHVLYGWMFFSLVIVLLILAGLPFREDVGRPLPVPFRKPIAVPGGSAVAAAAAVLLFSAAGPATAELLDRRADREQAALAPSLSAKTLMTFRALPGCVEQPGTDMSRRFLCDGVGIQVLVQTFSDHASPAALLAAERLATGEMMAEDAEISMLPVAHRTLPWRLVQTGGQEGRVTATLLSVDGVASLAGMRGRLRQARASVFGSALPSVLVAVSAAGMDAPDTRTVLQHFLEGQPAPPTPGSV